MQLDQIAWRHVRQHFLDGFGVADAVLIHQPLGSAVQTVVVVAQRLHSAVAIRAEQRVQAGVVRLMRGQHVFGLGHARQVIGEQVDGAVVIGAARRAAVGFDVVAQHRRSVSRAGQHMHFGQAGQRLAHAGGQSPHVVLGNRPRTIARHAEKDVLLG